MIVSLLFIYFSTKIIYILFLCNRCRHIKQEERKDEGEVEGEQKEEADLMPLCNAIFFIKILK